MCQLGACLVSTAGVFRKNGILSHADLLEIAPRDQHWLEVEYDFANREWMFLDRIPKHLHSILKAFEQDNWSTPEKLMNFVMESGVPESVLLVAPSANTSVPEIGV